ncbi:MAG: ATP-binding protein [Acidimicrobiia bacterium]|nr:ATP-binding protein [Acidimicrobiia bacterium]MYA38905.1 ATP-binding protein [Acidimicrobiia bacterium]MYG92557.1 ATP-binding protein [Acidimicrobiia bacterium]MYH05029.1 ATP-binding protein [Acidimicrobiia bacterium]MYK55742.1 ATP-binding protein [Acidimicrobiia bacterium]
MAEIESVGRVLGTDHSTPLAFWVAVGEHQHLQLDDLVAVDRVLPTGEIISIYGVVAKVRARHEGATFDSDVFLIADGVLPAVVSEAAEIQVTRVAPETFVPPLPGAPVRRVVGEERDEALDMTEVERKLPAGLTRESSQPMMLDLDFLDGTKGAHVNISGISGVATKTSYATFLLYSLFNSGVLGAAAANTKALIFNVKGEDLLFLDRPNNRLDEDQRALYGVLGLEARPFRSIGILAPPRRGDPNGTPHTGARTTGVGPLYWTVAQFCRLRLLPFLFADAEDERQQYTIVVHAVTDQLERCARTTPAGDGAVRVAGRTARTFDQLVDVVCDQLQPEDPEEGPDPRWSGRSVTTGTINAFVRRLSSARRHVDHLIRADLADAETHAIDLDSQQVTVVDLHLLHDRAKRFVVGVVLRQAFESKEESGTAEPLQFVVLDELNKYAPRSSSSPIKEILLDVAERGRSLGIILIGAQQTASEVERRIVSNSAVRVVGRLDTAEAGREQYGFLPSAQRQRSTILKPGAMFVSQPRLPVPVLIEFPFPAWATRTAEAGPDSASSGSADPLPDPFAGLT